MAWLYLHTLRVISTWWQQVEDLWRESSICAVWNWLKYWKSHQVCRGLIWAEMREQQEVGTMGQSENKEGRVKNRLFQISVRELISMLAEKCSNEESSIARLQSITSCSVVGWDGWVSFQEIQVIFEGKQIIIADRIFGIYQQIIE